MDGAGNITNGCTYLDQDDVGACPGEGQCHGLPDSPGAAGDEGGLAVEPKHFLNGGHGG
jgi:hypothetical protein